MLKAITLQRVNISYAARFLVILTMATGAPLIGIHSQWLTGPIVNMSLILAVFLIGIRGALLVGILPSTIALGTGLLPAILAPMIPFIIISNTILILVVDWFKNYNYFLGLFFAAGAKYLFLFITSSIVINLLLNQALAPTVAAMMSWPQFFTAVIGGVLAWGILKFINK
ncbi:hypothetical protein A3B87_00610 [Candidatus Kuenenbacteria bacterium RIFCSPHIGHO2_02_FULL_39_13]|uniref:Iron hydrogenase n=1 Tax=Candidatus Kuenenbacteria bacterium RIFCSPHIGHO2_02_FULL_39_13 TaxID=1798561 RepID=A0A1F6FP06_9BACT|nr:MAG: hypothetical protein A3B87_00610 [Candidatus Kuenenbacteria bacterium RIFCSPHIGHO2_02_FULL_39_13]